MGTSQKKKSVVVMPNQEQAKEAKQKGSACRSFCEEGPLAAATQPVAGPMVIKLIYNLLLLAVFILFISLLAEAAPTWNTPIVEVKAKFMKELEYPDMYFCIPPLGMSSIIEEKLEFSLMGLAKPKADVSAQKLCRGFSEMTRIRVSLTMDKDYIDCQSSVGISDARAVEAGAIYTNEKTPSDMAQFGFKEAKKIEGGSPFKVDDVAVNLADSMGTYKDPDDDSAEEVKAFCFSYINNNVTAKYDSNNVLMNVNALKLNSATAEDLLYMNAYFVPKGELPYKKVGEKYVATATSVLWPLKNSLTQAQLTTEVIQDTSRANARVPEEDRVYSALPKTQYKLSVNAQPTRLTVYGEDLGQNNKLQYVSSVVFGANSVRFGSLVQQNILIRDKTTAEIMAEVGGLWAGAALWITLLFKSSGYTTKGVPEDAEDRDGKPLMVARFLPGSVTKNHLAAYTKAEQAKQEAAAAEKSGSTVADAAPASNDEKPVPNDV